MNINDIKGLMNHMKSAGLTSFEYEGQGIKVKMEAGTRQAVAAMPAAQVPVAPVITEQFGIAPVETAVEQAPVISGKTVDSPIVGVFYESPGPDKPVFAAEGATVKKGEPLCIIEAMKVMNEINAECDMKILKVLVENEDIVEFGQPLFEVQAL